MQDESPEHKTFLTWNKVIGESTDTRLCNAIGILEYALISSQGAPLKEALIKAGVAQDISCSFDSGVRQPWFSIMARGTDESQRERFEQIIEDTLRQIASDGINEKALRAAIHSMEFRFREADYGTFPKGLMYIIDSFDSWLYDETRPFDYLRTLEDCAFLKAQIGTGYYEHLIEEYLLDNPHASTVTLRPSPGLEARREEKTREKLAAYKASLGAEELRALAEATHHLHEYQQEPSTEEELATIPSLKREDIRRECRPVSNVLIPGEVSVLLHDYETNGLAYAELLFDASFMKAEDLPWLGLLQRLLGRRYAALYVR